MQRMMRKPWWACVAGLVVLAVESTPAAAVDRFWVTIGGGVFGQTAPATNWSATASGAAGATVPGAADVANFTFNQTYTITFAANHTNLGLDVENGNVTLDLSNRIYTITDPSAAFIGGIANQTGRLTILDGTLDVNTAGDDIIIGSLPTSPGFLTVSTGGVLGAAFNPDLIIGNNGPGTLTANSGGRVNSNNVAVGNNAGATGSVLVTGAPTRWTNAGTLTVGLSGTADVTVNNGGTVGATNLVLGSNQFAQGTAVVTGAGSQWTGSSGLIVGSAGSGAIEVSAGGAMSATTGVLGDVATGVGTATISGANSTLALSSTLDVGRVGQGTMTVASGGSVTTGAVRLGATATGVGAANVTGAGSTWNANAAFDIGSLGSGTLTVADGALVSVNGPMSINDPAGAAVGTLRFHGGTIAARGFTRATGGVLNWTDGTLTLSAAGFNNNGADLTINGADADDRPTLRLTSGATTTAAMVGNVIIGADRAAALEITGGTQLNAPSISLGALDGGDGIVTVRGNASLAATAAVSGNLNIGGTGSGTGGTGVLNLETGGSAATAVNGQLRLFAGGTVNVNGGNLSYGTLTFNGGRVNFNAGRITQFNGLAADDNTLTAILGTAHQLGPGRTLSAGGSTATVSSHLDVAGGRIDGNLLQLAGAGTTSPIFRLRQGGVAQFNNGATLTAGARTYIDDGELNAGTNITLQGDLYLASTSRVTGVRVTNTGLLAGSGRIDAELANQLLGQVRVATGERLVFTSAINLSEGTIDVNGGTLEFTGGALQNGTANPATALIAARNATLRTSGGILNGGAIAFSHGVSDVFGDVTNLAAPIAGRIIVSGGAQANFFDDVTNNGTIQVSAAGSLQSTAVFFGRLNGNGVAGGGHVFLEGDARPGFSPGTMAFGGDLTFGPLASLQIELGGLTPGTQYDRVTVVNEAALAGTLDINLINGFSPTLPGQSFAILTAGAITGTFDQLLGQPSPTLPGLRWDVTYSPTAVVLSTTALPGDINLDGRVDPRDLSLFVSHLGRATGSIWTTGDFDGNGRTTLVDLSILQTHLGQVVPPSPAALSPMPAAAVPEPSASLLASLAATLATLISLRRRGKRANPR